jgi:hypothetical protein
MLPHSFMYDYSNQTSMLGRVQGCVYWAEKFGGMHRKITQILGVAMIVPPR